MWWLLSACAPNGPVGPPAADSAGTGCEGPCLADPGPDPEARVAFARLVVDPEGAAWVAYGAAERDRLSSILLLRSPAPGSLEPPVAVPLPAVVFAGATERPSLAVGATRVGLAFTGVDALRHGSASTVWLAEAPREAPLFGEPIRVETLEPADLPDAPPGSTLVVEHASLAYLEDDPWVVWLRQVWGSWNRPTWGRGSEGFLPRAVSEELSGRHDCSPPDFLSSEAGDPLLAVRDRRGEGLQTVVATGDGEGFVRAVQVSADRFPWDPEVCPEDGPRLVELEDRTLLAAWLAPEGGAARLHTATSADGGATWSEPWIDADGPTFGHRRLSLAPAGGGEVRIAAETAEGTTELLSGVPGLPPRRGELVGPAGEALTRVELGAGGGRLAAVGLDPEGRLLMVELEPEEPIRTGP